MAFLRYRMKAGMKTSRAVIIEWVGPRCIPSVPKNMSTSGIIERTRIRGMLRFCLRALAVGFPIRYASAMCPTANEVVFLLRSQTFLRGAIKLIGSWLSLGIRQSRFGRFAD